MCKKVYCFYFCNILYIDEKLFYYGNFVLWKYIVWYFFLLCVVLLRVYYRNKVDRMCLCVDIIINIGRNRYIRVVY